MLISNLPLKNTLNCISTAQKSRLEHLVKKRNNWRRLITDYLQFRTLLIMNSSTQQYFFQFFKKLYILGILGELDYIQQRKTQH